MKDNEAIIMIIASFVKLEIVEGLYE